MSKKYFVILGLILAAGFLFLNVSVVSATSYTWTGGGDATTWTDPLNWSGQAATRFGGFYPYPGATSTADTVTIASKTNAGAFVVRATTTPAGTMNSLVIGGAPGSSNGAAQLIIGNGITLGASSTVSIVSTSTLTMGDATWGSGTLRLTNGANNSIPLTIGGNATFTADTTATGTVTYAGGWNDGKPGNTILIASTTFYTLNLTPTSTAADLTFKVATSTSVTVGAGGGTFNTAATFVVATGATFTNNGTITATNATAWTNNGAVSQGAGAKIVWASASRFDDGAGTAKTAFSGDSRDNVGVQVTDTSLNVTTSAETQTVTVTAVSLIRDTETVTLTETGNSTGIFRGHVTFGMSGTNVGGQLDYQGPGTLSFAYTDSQDSSDTGSGSGTFTGTAPGGGSGGGGGGGGGTVTVAATPATPATPAETPATPATPAVPATPASPTLDSVSVKIASVVAKVAVLTSLSPTADIAAVQAEIAAILVELQSLQAASPTPQGVALGFNFVRPLALGLKHDDVSKLQEALKTDSSVYPEGLVTGYFGPATLKAVKKFQEKYGIASSGIVGYGNVGPKTRTKLNELYGGK